MKRILFRSVGWILKMKPIFFMLLFSIFFNSFAIGKDVKTIKIINKGNSNAVIVFPEDSSMAIKQSAKLLSRYIQESTQTIIPVYQDNNNNNIKQNITIHIGMTNYVKNLKLAIDNIDDDGFYISFPNDKNIIILGRTDSGTVFGVYEFLEKFIGVRWLFPGTKGLHIPHALSIDIPMQDIRQEPVFISRFFFGFADSAQKQWGKYNRVHGRIQFHHNLFRLFSHDKYKITHPHFFPVINGKRFLSSRRNKWQPCFSNDEIVNEAIQNICKYFDQNPGQMSYSLGINDWGGFCECDKCLKKYGEKKNYLGFSNASNLYFKWANAVVDGVLKKYPNKWFGCLAYSELAEPPSFDIHPRIIPFITSDRMKWIHNDIERREKKIHEMWSSKAFSIGWYDYIYGSQYCLPRVYFHKMKDYYQYAMKNNVKAMTAEAYPNWGEGPKLYIALKLQWDPSKNVEKLLNDWYTCAVGEQAATDLSNYYKLWESFWTKEIINSAWFKTGQTYLNFRDPSYLEVVTYDHIVESRKLLEAVISKTKTKKQRDRAKLILKAFEYYEASAISYLGIVKNNLLKGKSKDYYNHMNMKRYQLIDFFETDVFLIHPSRFDKKAHFKKLRW